MDKQYVADAPDDVNKPAHYTTGKIEVIDFIEDKKLGFHLGNVVKYVARADHKGSKMKDLQKAAWYLAREIDLLVRNSPEIPFDNSEQSSEHVPQPWVLKPKKSKKVSD